MGSRGNYYWAMGWVRDKVNNNSELLSKVIVGLAIAVLVGGFWSGVYAHILLTSGFDISSEQHVLLIAFNVTCTTFGKIPNGAQAAIFCGQSYSKVQFYVAFSDFLSTIIPVISLTMAIATLIGGGMQNSSNTVFASVIIGFILSLILNYIGYSFGFALLGGYANTPSYASSTTVVSTSTTSMSTTSTSISTSTTTIPPYTSCLTENATKAKLPITCSDPRIATNNSILFNFTLSPRGTSIYNVNLACTPFTLQQPINGFYPLSENGAPDLGRTNNGITFVNGRTLGVKWPCSTIINRTFQGEIWIRFTPAPGTPNVSGNPWDIYGAFDIYINASRTRDEYNQSLNVT